jgi:hypothetical protein
MPNRRVLARGLAIAILPATAAIHGCLRAVRCERLVLQPVRNSVRSVQRRARDDDARAALAS